MANTILTAEELQSYLGVDEDAGAIVSAVLASTLEEIERVTGVGIAAQQRVGVLNELLRVMVYLGFYGVRGDVQNLEFLQKRKTQLAKLLQYSEVKSDGVG